MRAPSGEKHALSTPSFVAARSAASSCPVAGVPQPRRAVVRRGDDAGAVGREARALHPAPGARRVGAVRRRAA